MFRLYLLRHGIPGDGADPPLSDEGAAVMERAAIGMARLGITFDLVLSSPLRRAAETARVVSGVITAAGGNPRVEIEPQLVGGCTTSALLGLLAGHLSSASVPSVLIVGHQPDMGRIAAALTGSEGSLPFGRGTLCCLEFAERVTSGSAALVFLMSAEQLARAG